MPTFKDEVYRLINGLATYNQHKAAADVKALWINFGKGKRPEQEVQNALDIVRAELARCVAESPETAYNEDELRMAIRDANYDPTPYRLAGWLQLNWNEAEFWIDVEPDLRLDFGRSPALCSLRNLIGNAYRHWVESMADRLIDAIMELAQEKVEAEQERRQTEARRNELTVNYFTADYEDLITEEEMVDLWDDVVADKERREHESHTGNELNTKPLTKAQKRDLARIKDCGIVHMPVPDITYTNDPFRERIDPRTFKGLLPLLTEESRHMRGNILCVVYQYTSKD